MKEKFIKILEEKGEVNFVNGENMVVEIFTRSDGDYEINLYEGFRSYDREESPEDGAVCSGSSKDAVEWFWEGSGTPIDLFQKGLENCPKCDGELYTDIEEDEGNIIKRRMFCNSCDTTLEVELKIESVVIK